MNKKSLFLVFALILALAFSSCNPQMAEKIAGGVAGSDPATDPNEHAAFFDIDPVTQAISLKSGVTVPDSLLIPIEVDGTAVKSVKNCKGGTFTSVTIPGEVQTIEDEAFMGCASLKVVTIQNGVKSIGDEAFTGCNALERVIVLSADIEIDDYAFPMLQNTEYWFLTERYDSLGEFLDAVEGN